MNVTINVHDTLVWWNSTGQTHTVSSTDASGELNSGNVLAGHTFSHTFNTPGTFMYQCNIHPSMKGTITVN